MSTGPLLTEDFLNKVDAVFFLNIEKIRQLFPQGSDPYIFEGFPAMKGFGIHYLTMTQKLVLKLDFREELMPHIRKVRALTEEVLSYWRELGLDVEGDVPYERYTELLRCNTRSDDTVESVIKENYQMSLEEFLALGKGTILDVELFLAAGRFDYARCKELLAAGANPRFNGFNEPHYNIYDDILSESGFLCNESLELLLSAPRRPFYVSNIFHTIQFNEFINWGACERLAYLFDDYIPDEPAEREGCQRED